MVEMMSRFGEPVGMGIAFLLTIAVFSYLIGDNVLFRIASHLFVGLAAGYVTILIVYGVIWQKVIAPSVVPEGTLGIGVAVGALLGLLLLVGRNGALGRPVVAYLVGVGAATAIGGALFGTLVPQAGAAAQLPMTNMVALVMGSLALVGTITTLVYFNFRARAVGEQATKRQLWVEVISMVGQGFVAITLGVLFAMTFTAALTAFVQRFSFIWEFLWKYVIRFFSMT